MVRKIKTTDFIECQSAVDYLELANATEDLTKAKKYLKKALELEPNNLEIKVSLAAINANTQIEHIQKLEEIIAHENKVMEEQGFFEKECMGDFWLILETRPYMRVRYGYALLLIDSGMIKKAITECETLLKLCKRDNLGLRHVLMHLYIIIEDEKSALKLHKKFKYEESTQFLLLLSILYYKLFDLEKSKKYIFDLVKINKDTKRFFKILCEGDLDKLPLNVFSYKPFTIEEYSEMFMENESLYLEMNSYFSWGYEILKKQK